MRMQGTTTRDRKDPDWLIVEIPDLVVVTQGHGLEDAYEMAEDLLITEIDDEEFSVRVIPGKEGSFVIEAEAKFLVPLMLSKQRGRAGMTLHQVAKRLGQEGSPNAYARYEKFGTLPSLSKLEELLRVVGAGEICLSLAR